MLKDIRLGLSISATLLLISIFAQTATANNLLIERNARPLLAESSPEALEPWETPLEGFFIRSHHNVLPARVDDSWIIEFKGLVAKPRKMTVRELKKKALPVNEWLTSRVAGLIHLDGSRPPS